MQWIGGVALIIVGIMCPVLGLVMLAIIAIYIFSLKKEMEKEQDWEKEVREEFEREKEFATTKRQRERDKDNNVNTLRKKVLEAKKRQLAEEQEKVSVDKEVTEDLMEKYRRSIK